jgi:serine/threonine protein kinase
MMNCRRCQQPVVGDSRWCLNCGHFVPETLIGRVLGEKYEVLGVLGMGAMGAVYRARRKHIGDEVVVKILLPHLFDELVRFRREVEAAAMVKHSNVVKIYDFDEARGDLPAFIAMEMVRGELLSDLLQREGRLEASRAVTLMIEICRGIGAAHQKNIPHRDLKPSNIMVVPPQDEYDRESVKVLDFGLAKLGDPTLTKLTMIGQSLGTPFYMSPEQWRGDENVGAPSDVYSLGVILYEMLAGALPFNAKDLHGMSQKHQCEAPPALPQAFNIQPALEAVLMHALAKDADARPGDATELARELQAAMSSQTSQPATLSPAQNLKTQATPQPEPTQPNQQAQVTTREQNPTLKLESGRRPSSPVMTSESNPLSKSALKPTESEPAQKRGGKLWMGLAAAALLVITGLAIAWVSGLLPGRNQPVTTEATTEATEPIIVKQSPPVSTPAPSPSTKTPTPFVELLAAWNTPRKLYRVALSPDGRTVASSGREHSVRLWQTGEQHTSVELMGAVDSGRSVAVRPDGQMIASGSEDGTIRVWQASDGHLLHTLQGHTQFVFIVSFSPDGQTLVSASGDKTIKLWRVSDGKLLGGMNLPKPEMLIINISPDQRTVALYAPDKSVQLWSLNENRLLATLQGHSYDVSAGAFSPDGEFVALGSEDGTVRLWQTRDGKLAQTLEGAAKSVDNLTFSPNGQIVAAGMRDGTIKLWQTRDANPLKTLEGHKKSVHSLSFSADGQMLASGGDDNAIRLWRLASQ